MPPRCDRWQRCAPVPAHMCNWQHGCPRGRAVGAFAHVRVSLSRLRCYAFVTTRLSSGESSRGDARLASGTDLRGRYCKRVRELYDVWGKRSHIFPRLQTVRFSPASVPWFNVRERKWGNVCATDRNFSSRPSRAIDYLLQRDLPARLSW